MKQLTEQVVQWAQDKGLLTDVTPERIEKQTLKVLEEIGETAGAYLKGNQYELVDGIGDIAVTIIILAAMSRYKIEPIHRDSTSLVLVSAYVCDFSLNENSDGLSFAYDTLENFAISQNYDLEDCLQSAYDVISKRTGKMVNGTFIKDK